MSYPSIIFKKLLCKYNRQERHYILTNLLAWLNREENRNETTQLYTFIQDLYQFNSHLDEKAFKDHYTWNIARNHDTNAHFQQIVKSKLAVPLQVHIPSVQTQTQPQTHPPRRNIPKKVRGELWKQYFNTSTSGSCYCCKSSLDAFGDWHAGHIIPRTQGGSDTQENLRPICGSCNLSMGTENMDAFKARCYSNV